MSTAKRATPLSWWEPAFGPEDAEAVAAAVRSGFVNEGAGTAAFTARVARALGVRHVQATCNGTTALYLALRACGVQPGDEVIVPDLTFVATANAVALCGATPVLVDVRPQDLNIDPERVAAAITARTRAILPVHVNGRPADLDALGRIAGARRLALIEDAAQALGSYRHGRALGTGGDAGCISLAPTKIITSGQGGLVLTDREALRDAVIRLKDHGRLARSWNYHPEVGFNFKYSDLHAALANAQFDRLPQRLELARRQYFRYRSALEGLPGISFLDTDLDGGTVPLWVDALVDDARGLIEFLRGLNIDCRPFWPAIHTQPCYARAGHFRHATHAARHGVWLPSGPGKSDDDLDEVIAAVREFLGRKRGKG